MAEIEQPKPELLQLKGALSFSTVTRVLKKASRLLKVAPERIVIDLSAVERVDSAGLALLVELIKLARQQNKQLCYISLPEQVQRLASMAGIDDLLTA